jgi:hypothetical protein
MVSFVWIIIIEVKKVVNSLDTCVGKFFSGSYIAIRNRTYNAESDIRIMTHNTQSRQITRQAHYCRPIPQVPPS